MPDYDSQLERRERKYLTVAAEVIGDMKIPNKVAVHSINLTEERENIMSYLDNRANVLISDVSIYPSSIKNFFIIYRTREYILDNDKMRSMLTIVPERRFGETLEGVDPTKTDIETSRGMVTSESIDDEDIDNIFQQQKPTSSSDLQLTGRRGKSLSVVTWLSTDVGVANIMDERTSTLTEIKSNIMDYLDNGADIIMSDVSIHPFVNHFLVIYRTREHMLYEKDIQRMVTTVPERIIHPALETDRWIVTAKSISEIIDEFADINRG